MFHLRFRYVPFRFQNAAHPINYHIEIIMSESDSISVPSLRYALDQVQSLWTGPVVVEDLKQSCCAASKSDSTPRNDRPCFWIHDVMSGDECDVLVRETLKYHQNPQGDVCIDPGVRLQFSSHDSELGHLLWSRIRHTIPEEIDGGTVVGLNPHISYARYLTGQGGFPHMDFRHRFPYGDNDRIGSRLSFTLYLDDDYTGGELSFVSELTMDGSIKGEHSKTKPRKGSAVVFYQSVPEFAHMPHAVTSGCKSIMRADVFYEFESRHSAMVGGLE